MTTRRWVVAAMIALLVLSVAVAATAWAQSTSDPCGSGDPCDQDGSSSASDPCGPGTIDPVTGREDPCDQDSAQGSDQGSSVSDPCGPGTVDPVTGREDPCDND
jgi:hypothetical protein